MPRLLTLVISFDGPFAFDFCKGQAIAYTAKCRHHIGFVSTDREKRPLRVGTYQPTLHLKPPTSGKCHNPSEIVLVDRSRCRNPDKPAKAPHWKIILPRPDEFAGLHPDEITIIEKDLAAPPPPVANLKATKMEFYYQGFDPSLGIQILSGGSTIIDTKDYPAPPALQTEFRFAFHFSGPESDPEHVDARRCFQAMRNMFPPLDKWKVHFPVGSKHYHIVRSHVNDCQAPNLVLAESADIYEFTKGGSGS